VSTSRPGRLTSRKRAFGRYFLLDCVRKIAGVDFLEKRTKSFACWQLNHYSFVHLILILLKSDQYFSQKRRVDYDGVPHPGRAKT
jgi:hypothetical protein